MLKSGESLFTDNVEALDFDFIPKLVPFREREQTEVAICIKPLFQKRNGKNILVHGKPGIGKTVAVKHLINEIEEEYDEIFTIYINCWQKNTSYKIMLEMCEQLGYKFTQSKKTDELLKVVTDIANNNIGIVIVFDEVDKVDDLDFMYMLLEEMERKSLILITNYKSWLENLDERIRSRLIPDVLEFKEYNEKETTEILKQRMKYAFVSDVCENDAFKIIADKTCELKDIRTGLYLLKEAGQNAENRSSKKIEKKDSEKAISKLTEFSSKETEDLQPDESEILELIKSNSGFKIGELFKLYPGSKDITYKTFQRKIKKLENGNYISVKKITGGTEGQTSIITYGGIKKLTEF